MASPSSSLQIVYASTSGHTEYVMDVLQAYLAKKQPKIVVSLKRAELATPEDLLEDGTLLLASGTWNTGGIEGQLNPHMHAFLQERAKDVDLNGKNVLVVALGDHRYFYTGRASEHLRRFVVTHNGHILEPELMIINEPYGQEERIRRWADKILPSLA